MPGVSGMSSLQGVGDTSGLQGASGTSGFKGIDGTSRSGLLIKKKIRMPGVSGMSSLQGVGDTSGLQGASGTSGFKGIDGTSRSGLLRMPGVSGTSGLQGVNGIPGCGISRSGLLRMPEGETSGFEEVGEIPCLQRGQGVDVTSELHGLGGRPGLEGVGRRTEIPNMGGIPGLSGQGDTTPTSGPVRSCGSREVDFDEDLPPELAGLRDMSEEDRKVLLDAMGLLDEEEEDEGGEELVKVDVSSSYQDSVLSERPSSRRSRQLASGLQEGRHHGGQPISQEVIREVQAAANQCTDFVAHGMNTIIIVDTSTSMRGGPLEQVQHVLENLITGIEDNAMENGLEENLALIVFGRETRVVQHLTSEYSNIRDAIEALVVGGPSDIIQSLTMTLGMENRGGALNIAGHVVTGRVLIVSDCQFTEEVVDSTNDIPDPDKIDMVHRDILQHIRSIIEVTRMRFYLIPVGYCNQIAIKSISELPGCKVIPPQDSMALSREYLHHAIAVEMLSQLTDHKDVLNVIRHKFPDVRDEDLLAANELIQFG